MLLSVVFIDLTRFTIKYAYQSNPLLTSMQQCFAKFVALLLLVSFVGVSSLQCASLCYVPRSLRVRLAIRSLIFTSVSVFQAYGIKMLTYSTSVIISFTAPLLAPFTAYLLLKERLTFCNLLALCISFAGVLIFSNPSLLDPNRHSNS